MRGIRIVSEPGPCRELWERLWPQQCLFDLWPVRECFAKHYQRPLFFLTREREQVPDLLLALSWIEEEGYFGHFPGETWQGKTWLEQNKLPGADKQSLQEIMAAIPGRAHIRYVSEAFLPDWADGIAIDETGYLFDPSKYDFSFETYRLSFSGKTRKKMEQDLRPLRAQTVSFRYQNMADVDAMMQMNLSAFGETSYFYDPRFFNAFIDLIAFLNQHRLLRITSVLIGGRLAAVDVGAVWRDTYTVMAGGTHPEFPGVAKLINRHHIQWACDQRLGLVDFLCGDFSWKERFRLQPRILYQVCLPVIESSSGSSSGNSACEIRGAFCEA